MQVLESERAAALEAAAAARAEVSELQETQRRLTWQSQLLEKMSEVGGVPIAAPAGGGGDLLLSCVLLRVRLSPSLHDACFPSFLSV